MRWFSGCSWFSPRWEKDICNLGFSVYISDCLWSWLGWMAVHFIRQAIGAYCIRPSNVLSGTILHYTKTHLRCLRQHMWGVCNTPLPHTDKEGFSNGKTGCFRLSNLLFLPWCKIFLVSWSSFLLLIEEKKQKKIKPSAEGEEVWSSTCLGGRMLLRPYISWYTDILRIKMYPGRGVSHTPSERFQRKRRDTPRHKNNHSPPSAASRGRIRYAPTL